MRSLAYDDVTEGASALAETFPEYYGSLRLWLSTQCQGKGYGLGLELGLGLGLGLWLGLPRNRSITVEQCGKPDSRKT